MSHKFPKVIVPLVLITILVMILSAQSSVAYGQIIDCGSIVFNIDPTSGPPGTDVTFSGSGAMGDSPYDIYWDVMIGLEPPAPLFEGTTDSGGNFGDQVSVPIDAAVGQHIITFLGTDPQEGMASCAQYFTVTETPQGGEQQQPSVQQNAYTGVVTTAPAAPSVTRLPSTGAFLVPAAGFLLAGAGALVARRRR